MYPIVLNRIDVQRNSHFFPFARIAKNSIAILLWVFMKPVMKKIHTPNRLVHKRAKVFAVDMLPHDFETTIKRKKKQKKQQNRRTFLFLSIKNIEQKKKRHAIHSKRATERTISMCFNSSLLILFCWRLLWTQSVCLRFLPWHSTIPVSRYDCGCVLDARLYK